MKTRTELEKVIAGGLLIDPQLCKKIDVRITDPLCLEVVSIAQSVIQAGGGVEEMSVEVLKRMADKLPSVHALEDTWAGHGAWYYALKQLQADDARHMAELELKKISQNLARADGLEDIAREIELAEARLVEAYHRIRADQYSPLTIKDLMAYQPQEQQDSILGDCWIKRGAMTLFSGQTGMGKSVFVEQLAVHVAAGKSFFGMRARKSKVLLIEAENDMDILQRDILSIMEHADIKPDEIENTLNIVWAYSIAGSSFHSALEKWVQRVRPDLLIVDNYQSFFGGRDINSSGEWDEWFRPVMQLCADYMMGLFLVDHMPKPKAQNSEEESSTRYGVYAAAGTSRKSNCARTAAELVALPNEETRFCLRFSKNAERNGLRPEDGRGRIVRELYLEHSGNPQKPYWLLSENQQKSSLALQQEILDALAEEPGLTIRELAKRVGTSKSTVARVLEARKITLRK